MALSQRTTTVAVLRGVLGAVDGQEERFALLAGRSVSWVKKVSAGITPLSEEAALALETGTGVSAGWLLGGDTGATPVSVGGTAYNYAAFEDYRAGAGEKRAPEMDVAELPGVLAAIAGIGAAAGRQGKGSLFNYRLSRFLRECREEFGVEEGAAEEPAWEGGLNVRLL